MTIENSESKWSRSNLKRMLYHNFLGTIADNIIEIGWIFIFSLYVDKQFVERITSMLGLNDIFWVVLTSTYYASRTVMVSRLPKALAEGRLEDESKIVKNTFYLFWMYLIPICVLSFIFMPRILVLMGVSLNDFDLYLPYFRLSVIAILVSSQWSTMVPSYYRAKGQTKKATILDHYNAWVMLGLLFVFLHIFKLPVVYSLVACIIGNLIPLAYFLYDRPIKDFWSKGFEFDWSEIKINFTSAKWELIRRMLPRLSLLISSVLAFTVNPIIVASKYWLSNLSMFVSGWVESMAGLLNINVSRNVGLKEDNPAKDNEYVYKLSVVGILITVILMSFMKRTLVFLPNLVYEMINNPIIDLFLFIDLVATMRYYMWLSIARSWKHELQGYSQVSYALASGVLTPILTYFALQYNQVYIFGVGAVVGIIQMLLVEFYFRKRIKNESK